MTKDNLKRLSANERLGQHRDSEYLGAEDIDPGKEPILTIDGIWYGQVTLQRGKENKDVISFREDSVDGIHKVRPLIVNTTNRKVLKKLFSGVQANTLEGKRIQLYIDHNVKDPQDGGKTDGVRIRSSIPKEVSPLPPCSSCGEKIIPPVGKPDKWMLDYTVKQYGRPLCVDCAAAVKAARKQSEEGVPTETEAETATEDTESET
jgi:3-phosphoglycerate kinase